MVQAYFENRRGKYNLIAARNKTNQVVIDSLNTVETDALRATKPYIDIRRPDYVNEQLRQEKIIHTAYLAVRLQREKMEQIQEYLATFQSFYHNALCFNLFYSASYLDLTNDLPNPASNLEQYINKLVENITKNKKADELATQRQLYLGTLLSLIGLGVLLISVITLSSTTIGLALMGISLVLLPLTLVTTLMTYSTQITKEQRLNLIENDCVPKIARCHIQLGNVNSDFKNGGILLYLDPATNNIMCHIVEPTVYEETFVLTLNDKDQDNTLKNAINSQSSFLSLSRNTKQAIRGAID